MADPSMDAGGFFTFDLEQGKVSTRNGRRVVVLSDSVLGPLLAAAVASGDLTVMRRLGRHLGEEVRSSLGGGPEELSIETVTEHLATALSIFGWGRLEIEVWGGAMLARVFESPTVDVDQLALAALLGGLFSTVSGTDVACVPVSEAAEFLLVAPAIAEVVWGWAREGESVAGILALLAPEAA